MSSDANILSVAETTTSRDRVIASRCRTGAGPNLKNTKGVIKWLTETAKDQEHEVHDRVQEQAV